MGAFGQMGEILRELFLFIYLFIPFLRIHLQDRAVDGFSRLMAGTTLTRLLRISLILLPILRVKSAQTHNFEGVNRHFQAKPAEYRKFLIIESAASILTKFCTVTKTTT